MRPPEKKTLYNHPNYARLLRSSGHVTYRENPTKLWSRFGFVPEVHCHTKC